MPQGGSGLRLIDTAGAAPGTRVHLLHRYDKGWLIFSTRDRAELAFAVMEIAYVEHQTLSEEAFITLMVTAFWRKISVPITVAWWKPYFSGDRRFFR